MNNTPSPYNLAPFARDYAGPLAACHRPQADPLGRAGLPACRLDLDALVDRMTGILQAVGVSGIGGGELAARLGIGPPRTLRLLVAYARVHHHVHQIVGIPGSGYFWGDCKPGLYHDAIADATKRGRCYFFIAALHKRKGTAIAAAQMVLDLFHQHDHADRHNDELAAMVAAEGADVGDLFDAMITQLAETADGRQVLSNATAKHADLMIPAAAFEGVLAQLDTLKGSLTSALKGHVA